MLLIPIIEDFFQKESKETLQWLSQTLTRDQKQDTDLRLLRTRRLEKIPVLVTSVQF